jgi:hypothetical protein
MAIKDVEIQNLKPGLRKQEVTAIGPGNSKITLHRTRLRESNERWLAVSSIKILSSAFNFY